MDNKEENVLAARYPTHERIMKLVDDALDALGYGPAPEIQNARAFLNALHRELMAPRD